jgi:cell wall-associated NlpC family hydrolase
VDIADLIGKPYAPGGNGPEAFDCWGLVVEVRRRMGLPTPVPVPGAVPRNQPRQTAALVHRALWSGLWRSVPVPVPGDLVALGSSGRAVAVHIGVVVPGGVLHAHEAAPGRGQVVLSSFAALRASYSRVEVARCDQA